MLKHYIFIMAVVFGCMPLTAKGAPDSNTAWVSDWNTVMDMAEGETQTEDGQLIATTDGNCVGVYTTGGGANLFEGKIAKYDLAGTELWNTSIQAITSTTAERVAEGTDGVLYVAGTTLDNGVTRPYVASIDAGSGTLKQLVTLPDGDDTSIIGCIKVLSKGIAFFYTTRNNTTLKGSYYYNLFDFDLTLKESSSYTPTTSTTSLPVDVVANDQALVAVLASGAYVDGMILTFNIESSDAPKELSGNYQAGDADADGFTFVKSGNNGYYVERCIYSNGFFSTLWSTSLSFETNYYSPMVRLAADGNVYFWHKSNYQHRVAKLNGEDGSIVWSVMPNAIGDIGGGFAYTIGTDLSGDFVAGGHSGDFNVYWYKLSAADGSVVSTVTREVNEDLKYTYTFDGMSTLTNGVFYFAGFMWTGNSTDGYCPFFTAFNTADTSAPLFDVVAERNFVPANYPSSGFSAADGTTFVALTVSNKPALAKYSAEGALLWYVTVPTEGEGRFAKLNADGTITLVGSCVGSEYGSSRTMVAEISGEGELTNWSPIDNGLYFLQIYSALWDDDGTLYVVSRGMDSSSNSGIVVEKISPTGECSMVLVPTNVRPYSASLNLSTGEVLMWGYSYDANYVSHPSVVRAKIDGTLLFDVTISGGTSDSMLYTAWTDSQGNTYVGGIHNGSYAYLAVLDSAGNVLSETADEDLGYYENIIGTGDSTPIAIGTIAPAGTTSIVGVVKALNTATVNTQWSCNIADPSSEVYALQGVATDNAIAISGYKVDGVNKTEMVTTIGLDGELQETSCGGTVNDVRGEYHLASTVLSPSDDNSLTVLSAYSIADLAYVGIVSKYNFNNQGTWVKAVTVGGEKVGEMWHDLNGRRVLQPGTGIYLRTDRYANGTTHTVKVRR